MDQPDNKPIVIVHIDFENSEKPKPTIAFFCQLKFEDEDPGHPYGQFSGYIDPVEGGKFEVEFVSPDAPHHKLELYDKFELYRGPFKIGTARKRK